ncbi:hypothetical protein LTS18_011694, partial [Coniosporium uncinatum]
MPDSRSSSVSHPPSIADSATSAALANNAPAPAPKKGKGKKSTDPADASKQIAAKIAQLELDAAGEKDQEAEIEASWIEACDTLMTKGVRGMIKWEQRALTWHVDREVKKATRELSHLLSNIEAPMNRLDTVQKKYAQLLAEMKRVEQDHKKAKKRADQLQKEKDAARSELSKANQAKDRLEKLSRDLSVDNRKLKTELQRLEKRDSEERAELHERLENMMAEVEDAIQAHENPELQPANIEMEEMFKQKFKSFIDQYELRELQFTSLLRTKELELQYQVARLEQQRKAQEMESSKSHQLTRQVSTFSQTETELRSQLNIYVEKFKQLIFPKVEDTLNNSNDLFLTFRKEMEEMSKKTKRLEKENSNLTRKQQATNDNILKMAEERTRMEKEMEDLRKKNERLERLCRGMQDQGRGQVAMQEADIDETESEYDEDEYEDEEISGE